MRSDRILKRDLALALCFGALAAFGAPYIFALIEVFKLSLSGS